MAVTLCVIPGRAIWFGRLQALQHLQKMTVDSWPTLLGVAGLQSHKQTFSISKKVLDTRISHTRKLLAN